MNNRQLKIKKIILDEIKPDDCQVCFIFNKRENIFKHNRSSHYNPLNKLAVVLMYQTREDSIFKKSTLNNIILHQLLHEICHHFTWKKRWNKKVKPKARKGYKWHKCKTCGTMGIRSEKTGKSSFNYDRCNIGYDRTAYLSEYQTEKLLRRLCKRHGLHEVLKTSDEWVTENAKRKKYNEWDYYVYAGRRIHREEMQHANTE